MGTVSTIRSLVERAREGDREAFDEIVSRFRGPLRSSIEKWSRFRLGPLCDVDDVIQEAFLRAQRSMGRFECSKEDDADLFLRWLCGIAKRALGDLYRKAHQREKPAPPTEPAASGPSQSRIQRRQERFDRLQEALDGLPPDYRRVLILSRLEGLSAQEVADRMGRTPNAVYHLIVRALQMLRDRFGDTESFNLPDRPLRREESGDAG